MAALARTPCMARRARHVAFAPTAEIAWRGAHGHRLVSPSRRFGSGCGGGAQGLAARRQPTERDLDVFLLWRLARSPAYLAGLALTALGFLLALVALRHLPLFVVQATRASSLGVTALVAVPVLGTRLLRYEVVGLIVVAVGLTMLGLSATVSPAPTVGLAWRMSLFAVVAILALAALVQPGGGAASGYCSASSPARCSRRSMSVLGCCPIH